MQEKIQWQTVRAAQRHADPERLSDAGAIALTAALRLVGELGPYVVGEAIVRDRLRVALALCQHRPSRREVPSLQLTSGQRGA